MGKLGGEYTVQQCANSETQSCHGMASQDFFRLSQNVGAPRRLNASRALTFQRHDAAQIPQAKSSLVWLFGIYSGTCDGERGNE